MLFSIFARTNLGSELKQKVTQIIAQHKNNVHNHIFLKLCEMQYLIEQQNMKIKEQEETIDSLTKVALFCEDIEATQGETSLANDNTEVSILGTEQSLYQLAE